LAQALGAVFAHPVPLLAGAEAVGDPIAVLPVLVHLLWLQDLTADLSVSLHPSTVLSPPLPAWSSADGRPCAGGVASR